MEHTDHTMQYKQQSSTINRLRYIVFILQIAPKYGIKVAANISSKKKKLCIGLQLENISREGKWFNNFQQVIILILTNNYMQCCYAS